MESILIGNGINIANGNAYLNAENVKKRFLEVLKNKYKLFEKCLGVKELSYDNIINEILKDNSNVCIEQLSGKLFDYFYKLILKDNKFCWNDCYRLIELIGVISIESLFIVDNKFKAPIITEMYANKIKKYNNIFTLNYVENWDKENRCIYLHGNINKYLSEYNNQEIISNILANTLNLNSNDKRYIKLNLKDVIFIPDNKIVDKYCYVGEGLFCNKCGLEVYPANDLFPDNGKGDIYKCLNDIKNIDIFGMSPYGDKSLIERISNIQKITIYVYNSKKEEIDEWKKYIPHAIFKDAKEFMSKNKYEVEKFIWKTRI